MIKKNKIEMSTRWYDNNIGIIYYNIPDRRYIEWTLSKNHIWNRQLDTHKSGCRKWARALFFFLFRFRMALFPTFAIYMDYYLFESGAKQKYIPRNIYIICIPIGTHDTYVRGEWHTPSCGAICSKQNNRNCK